MSEARLRNMAIDECYDSDGTVLACTTAVTLVWRLQIPAVISSLVVKLAQTYFSTPNSRHCFYVVFWSSSWCVCVCVVLETGQCWRQYFDTSNSAWQHSRDVALFGNHCSNGTLCTDDSA